MSLNNLEKHYDSARAKGGEKMPTGTRKQVGEELLRRCQERDARLEKEALTAEREGDQDGCWLAMASRAENKRVMDKIKADLEKENL